MRVHPTFHPTKQLKNGEHGIANTVENVENPPEIHPIHPTVHFPHLLLKKKKERVEAADWLSGGRQRIATLHLPSLAAGRIR